MQVSFMQKCVTIPTLGKHKSGLFFEAKNFFVLEYHQLNESTTEAEIAFQSKETMVTLTQIAYYFLTKHIFIFTASLVNRIQGRKQNLYRCEMIMNKVNFISNFYFNLLIVGDSVN